ncbi:MAG: gamma-butyrobetaine hydroxylase-like domain-containing protein [Rhodospirillales bacterium]
MTEAWPTELRIDRAARVLEVDFDDGRSYRLPAELLRVESPSAEVKGHNASERRLVAGKRAVGIADVEAVGNYAVRILFDDGHDTGIFSWRYLAELGAGQDDIWRRYLDAIAAAGLSRD